MKRLLMFIFLGIFFLSFASALEWDNAISDYDEETETITFRNGCVFEQGWTCTGSEIGKVQLNTPKILKVGAGYNYVWELDAWVYEDYNDFLKQFEYLDMKTKVKVNRDLDIKILSHEDIIVEDYITECFNNTENNGTITTSCNEISTGSHTENVEVWTKVTPSDLKKNERVTLRGYTNVEVGDYVDWSPVIFGVRVSHDIWAEWTQSLNVQITNYWKEDEQDITGSGTIIDSLGTNNGTNSGASNTTGKIKTAYDFDGSNDRIDFPNIPFDYSSNFTINLWFNADTLPATNYLLTQGSTGDDNPVMSIRNSNDKLRWFLRDANLDTMDITGGTSMSTGTWYMGTVTWDSVTKTGELFLDGSSEGSDTNAAVSTQVFDTFNLGVLERAAFSGWWDGELDEVGIWGRILSDDEIIQLYNGGTGISWTDIFGTAPEVTLSSPADTANLTSGNVEFISIVTDDQQVFNVTLFIDGVLNETNSSGHNGTYIFDKTLDEGVHNWSILAFDNDSLSNQSETRTLNITIPPILIDLISPSDTSTHETPTVNMTCIAHKDVGVTQLNLTVFGDTLITVTNSTPGENLTISQNVNFSEGNYTWGCSAINLVTSAVSSNRTFEVLYSFPVVNLFNPANDSEILINNVTFEFSATDINGIANISLSINGLLNQTNTSGVSGNYSILKMLPDGEYTWNVNATSIFAKTTVSETRSFLLHTTDPAVEITAPSGDLGYFLLGDNETLEYNISEAGENLSEHLVECWYVYPQITNAEPNGTMSQANTYNLSNGSVTGFITGTDLLVGDGEIGQGVTRLLTTQSTNGLQVSGFSPSPPDCITESYSSLVNPSSGTVGQYFCARNEDEKYFLVKHLEFNSSQIVIESYDISPSLNCSENTTSFTYTEGANNISVFALDEFGFVGTNTSNWTYKVLETNQEYNNITSEGATEQFSINFTKREGTQISVISLVYNGTESIFANTVDGNEIYSSGSITIPTVSSDTNVSFYWNIIFGDDSIINTSSNNQTITSIDVDNCSSFSNVIYNFTQYDEENQSILGGNNTIELQINLYDTKKTSLLTNFSDTFTGINPVQFCAEDAILPTVNYSSYVVVKYYVNGSSVNSSYSIEYYNILNQTISNTTIPINIALYNLRAEDTTKFRLTFRDDEYVLAPNILVQVHRQYIKDNDFKIVEIPLTDSNGQTMLNLVKDTIIYNFIMVNEAGEVVGTFNSIAAFCQDIVIGDCTINLAPDSDSEQAYDYNEEFDISFSRASYNNVTERISISFVTGDLIPKTVSMNIVRNNQFGNRSVCSASLLSASGVLSCSVEDVVDTDQFLFISTFVEDELAQENTIDLNADVLNFGTLNGAFYAFLLLLFLISMFMEDRKALVMSLGLGWVAVISLGLMNGKLIGFTSAGVWILVSIGVFLWKLNSEENP